MVRRLALVWVLLGVSLAACGDDAGFPDARVFDSPPGGGTVSLTWTLAAGTQAVTCEQIGAVTVTLTFFPKDAGFGFSEAFMCKSASGTTGLLAAGTYDVEISLGGGGGAVATLPRMVGIQVKSGEDTPLGAVAFDVDATGGVRFRIKASGVGSNCAAINANGAGIQAMGLELRSLGGTCLPTTFDIAAGAAKPASTYANDCGTPAPAPCLDADQDITIASVTSGRYQLALSGLIAGTACWAASPVVRAPAGGAIGSVGNLSLIRTGAAGCP